ncbi:MFS transporter [Streptomyces sp. NBC_01224]|uniref:MFS transporter n=1 Tax=Streptomyces sp. NBC_01224 TaxID=2903783 RepID=UPI002E11BBCB|nr:MFS transporter [Streptomyces sp. NBC_01224]
MADRPSAHSETAEGLFSRTYAAATSGFAAVMFLTGLAALAVVPTLPTAARDLDGVSLFPLVAGCFVAASLLGGVLGGHWADRAGAQRPLAAGMVLAVVTLLVSAASTSIWQLAAGRFLDGLAGGMVAVSINAAIGQAYPDRLRSRALALMSACWIIPSLVGPPLAGLVSEWWSWRAVFYGLAALTVLPALAVVAVLPALAVVAVLRGRSRPAAPAESGDRPPRPALMVATAVSVGAALGQYGASGWDLRHLLFAVGGLALLVVFTPRLLPPGTWCAVRGLPATVLLRGLSSGVFFTLEALVPLMLVTGRDVAPVVTGLAFTGAAVAWAASSWIQSRLLERVPRHRLVVAGELVLATAVVVAAVGTLPAMSASLAASAMVVAAVGMGLLAPSLTVLSLSHAPSGRQGYASSAMQTSQNLGQITVLGVSSALFNACAGAGSTEFFGYRAAFGLLLAPCVLATLLATRARSA